MGRTNHTLVELSKTEGIVGFWENSEGGGNIKSYNSVTKRGGGGGWFERKEKEISRGRGNSKLDD